MITIEINGIKRRLEEASERWIRQEINRRLKENGRICVLVTIVQPPDMTSYCLPQTAPAQTAGVI
jgi:hypothetical protein